MLNKNKKSKNNKNKAESYEHGRTAKGMKIWSGNVDIGTTPSGQTQLANLHSTTTTSSNGVGVMAAEITFNPNTANEWASFAARYREYRVVAVEVEYVPYATVNLSTIVGAPLVVAQNKAAALGTPASYAQVYSMGKPKVKHVFKPFSFTIVADDLTDLDMGGTATPASEFSFVFYADGLSNSILYGRWFFKWLVQFSSVQ